jgi:hypothetical protein
LLKEPDVATVFLRASASDQEIESNAPIDLPLGKDVVFAWLEVRLKIMACGHHQDEIDIVCLGRMS